MPFVVQSEHCSHCCVYHLFSGFNFQTDPRLASNSGFIKAWKEALSSDCPSVEIQRMSTHIWCDNQVKCVTRESSARAEDLYIDLSLKIIFLTELKQLLEVRANYARIRRQQGPQATDIVVLPSSKLRSLVSVCGEFPLTCPPGCHVSRG